LSFSSHTQWVPGTQVWGARAQPERSHPAARSQGAEVTGWHQNSNQATARPNGCQPAQRGQAPASSEPLPEHNGQHQQAHSATLQENILKGQMEDGTIALQDEEGAAFIFTLFHKPKHHKRKKEKEKQSCPERTEHGH